MGDFIKFVNRVIFGMVIRFCNFVFLQATTSMIKKLFVILLVLFPIGFVFVNIVLLIINVLSIPFVSVPGDILFICGVIKYSLGCLFLSVMVSVIFGKSDISIFQNFKHKIQ